VTGPVPGLFSGATYGAQAFAAYQNSLGGVYGRKIRVETADDHLDDGTNKAQVQAMIPRVFGFLGSFSVNDYAGADDMQKAGIPDVGFALSRARGAISVNFSPAPNPPGWRLGSLNYFKAKFGDAVIKHMAMFWI